MLKAQFSKQFARTIHQYVFCTDGDKNSGATLTQIATSHISIAIDSNQLNMNKFDEQNLWKSMDLLVWFNLLADA